jgi:hypothetical protein
MFALALVLCSLKTGECTNYVARLYGTRAECEAGAIHERAKRHHGGLVIYCTPTTRHHP